VSFLINSQRFVAPTGSAPHFITAASVPPGTYSSGFNDVPLPGIQSGDIVIRENFTLVAAGAATIVGETSLSSASGASSYYSSGWVIADSTNQTNGSVTVSNNTSASFIISVWRTGTSVLHKSYTWADTNTASPTNSPSFTKNASSKVCLFTFLSPVSLSSASPDIGTQVFQSGDHRHTITCFDPSSGYTNGTNVNWTFTSSPGFFLASSIEIT
jgi:hypothetical protein